MKKIFLYITILAGVFSMSSCLQDTDSKFDDSALVRVKEALIEYNEVLQGATNGWSMEYYPGPNRMWGGFNLLVKFEENNKVSMQSFLGIMPHNNASETILEQDKVYNSSYSMLMGDGPMISFDTFNDILHYFSEPKTTVGEGQARGYRGDYEFNLYEVSKEKVVMRGRKTNNWIVMTPIPESVTWDSVIEETEKLDTEALFNVASVVENGTKVGTATLLGERTLVFRDMEGTTLSSSPFTLTSNALSFYHTSPAKTPTSEVGRLEWDGSNFVSKDGTIKLEPQSQTPLKQLHSLMPLYFSGGENMSESMQGQFEQSALLLMFNGISYYEIQLDYLDDAGTYLRLDIPLVLGGSLYTAYVVLEYTEEGDDVINLNIAGFDSIGNGKFAYDNGASYFVNAVANNKTFVLTSDSPYRTKKITFTEKDNPNMWFSIGINVFSFY